MKGFIVHPTYKIKDGKAYVYLFGRLQNGESFLTINEFRPYFFIKQSDLNTALEIEKFDYKETKYKTFDEEPVVKIIMHVPPQIKPLRNKLLEQNISCYEADIRFEYRFMYDHRFQGSLEIEGNYAKGEEIDRVYLDPELKPADYTPKNLKVLSIDIETDITHKQIYAVSLYTDDFKKVIIISDKKLKKAISVADEKELIFKFQELLLKVNPDIITGWNLIDFDLKFLENKFSKYNIPFLLGRGNMKCSLRIFNSFFQDSRADFPGRMILDGIQVLKNNFIGLPNYKLETAAQHFLGTSKIFTGKNRFEQIENAYKKDQQLLVDYNLLDSKLAYDILYKSTALSLSIQRSLLTGMPLDRVRASIASLDSLYLKELRKKDYVAGTSTYNPDEAPGLGGFVMEPKPGIYDYVIVCDFKSLYPSIIRTFNIDPLSFVADCKGKNLVKAPNGACFKNQDGLLPIIIQRLWSQREKARKEKNEFARFAIKILMNSFYGVLGNNNCRFHNRDISNAITYFGQHFIKMTAQKVKDMGYEVIYGDSVAADSEVIVQDANGNVLYKNISDIFFKVDKRSSDGKSYSLNIPYSVLTIDSSGKSVFKPISYVMRHKVNKKMHRVYLTNSWFVDVTEDHSLIGYINKSKKAKLSDMDRLVEVKPNELGKNVKSVVSIKSVPHQKITTKGFSKEFYEFMGLFIGDGSFDSMKKKNYYLHLAAGLDQNEIIRKVIVPLKSQGWIRNYWKKPKGDICINGTKIVYFFNENLLRDKHKCIPEFIFNESNENIASFLRGLFSADGTVMIRNGSPIVRFTNTNKEFINQIQKLLQLISIPCSFFSETNKNKYCSVKSDTISLHIVVRDILSYNKFVGFVLNRKNKRLKKIPVNSKQKRTIRKYDFDISSVKRVEEILYKDYVYDLEVKDNHRFFANGVLVHNTDSIFVNLNVNNYADAQKIGNKIARIMNKFFEEHTQKDYKRKNYLELEFEKVYKRFLMPMARHSEKGSKKRYAGFIEDEKGKTKMDFVGLEFVRKDWTDIAKQFQQELLDRIFKKQEVAEYVKNIVEEIKNGKHDKSLIYRKSIRKGVAEYTKTTPPHVKAARLLGKELDGTLIEYVMTTAGPEPIQKQKHKIDYEHYIEKQIKPLADSVLGFYGQSFDDILAGSSQQTLFGFGKK
ncbi:MAG: hypothetical protein KKF46_04345 [Nanoarchaeota archaeon]|nr:hypothetical protein [Nanoarchaeota archaeon]MBU1321566.1 hypothetical protein [Nanoarchaeota archaeon]MBU1596846.1 hypothetical protein [Nanoarchaeota archaeon]MBU2442116.1 hypothetical protein [Nanoarchaeota archaeon]